MIRDQGPSPRPAAAQWLVALAAGFVFSVIANAEGFRILDDSGYAQLSEPQREEYLAGAQEKRDRDSLCIEEADALLAREEGWIIEATELRERLQMIHARAIGTRDSLMEAAIGRSEDGGAH